MRTFIATLFSLALLPVVIQAAPADFTFHEYFVYRDFVAALSGGATLELGEWDYHDEQGHWIEVPRVIPGRLAGPGTVTSGAFNGLKADPNWIDVIANGSFQSLELRGAEDDGMQRGQPGAWGDWTTLSDETVPAALVDLQYLSYRLTLADGEQVNQVDLRLSTDIKDAHPRLLVDDLDDLRARCTGALSHQCEQNAMFANSGHLTASLDDYSESELARIAKVMAFEYMMTGQAAQADRVRQCLLRLASYDRQHWVDLRAQIQDLGLGWIGLSWMLALDWAMDDLRDHPADLQAIADGTAVFVDYLLEMYKHSDFNNHFYLGRSPVLLAGLALHNEGLRDADAGRYISEAFDFLFNHEHPALNTVAGDMGGWHESLGYFDGEMGSPVMIDMDGLRTATGLDFFQSSAFWRSLPFWYLSSTVPWDQSLIHWADQGKDRWSQTLDGSASEGKGVRGYLTGLHKNLARLGYDEALYAQGLLDDFIGVFYDSGNYAESFYKVAHLTDVLWYTPGAPKAELPTGPASSHFANLGEVILREGNGADDAMAMFACADFRGGHQQSDNGHFSIWYKGYLAVDSGYYDGWGSSHHMNYARRSIAHNTLTVTMPGESFTNTDHNDGGQAFSCDTSYYNYPAEDSACDACDMWLSSRAAPAFDFIGSDLTRSYLPDKVQQVTRQFVYLRPDRFVVFDRVHSSDASYAKRFLLHGQAGFSDDGESRHVDDGEGRLFVQTLLPLSANVIQVGGAGHEWEVDGVNYPPGRGQDFAGTHRLEISPNTPAAFDNFLHLLQVTDQNVAQMATGTLLHATDATGLWANDWVLWFGTRGPIDGLAYELNAGQPTHVIVADLQAETPYAITVGDTQFTEISDAHGILFFEDDRSDQHTIIVGEGELPDGGSIVDAGTEDAGTEDAGIEDAGAEDAGGSDAGEDAGQTGDAGIVTDGGIVPDGGTITDGGTGSAVSGGCGCNSGTAGSLVPLFLLLAGLLRRRKKPTD